jgi:hypothetical protein
MSAAGEGTIAYWRSAGAVRDVAERVLTATLAGESEHFVLRMDELLPLAARVVAISRAAYPDLARVPVHGRYRHFGDLRLADLESRLAGASTEARLAARADLVITSVLLDAGAGASWRYRDPRTGQLVGRSEGLALASYDWLVSGALSASSTEPLRADAARLVSMQPTALSAAFQVSTDNPLVGVSGRIALLSQLGQVVQGKPSFFVGEVARPGNLALFLASQAHDGALPAASILAAILDALADIWPGRETLDGASLGDVWKHPRFGRVPFHKLSQWLAYSLFEPLEQAGVRIIRPDELTGLAEYRNGGLFIDGGVIVARDPDFLTETHPVGSAAIIEWRALTVALVDRLAAEVRRMVGLSDEELPLAKVLEAGTWRAGRVLAFERRSDGSPPIRVESDGTVF